MSTAEYGWHQLLCADFVPVFTSLPEENRQCLALVATNGLLTRGHTHE